MESAFDWIELSCGNPTTAKADRLKDQIGGNFMGGS
jgi:hypothetical protein